MFAPCTQNPKGSQHCLCVTGERCCWCGTASPAHGPYREEPLDLGSLRKPQENKNRCKCGAPADALHGCLNLRPMWGCRECGAVGAHYCVGKDGMGLTSFVGTGGAGAR